MPYIEENLPYRVPYQIYVDPTNLCNFRCHFCPTGNKKLLKEVGRPAGMMDLSIFKKFVDDLSLMIDKYKQKPDMIYLFKDGEPTMNPDLPLMIKLLNAKNLTDCIHLTTNGSLLTPTLSRDLIESGLKDLRFSIYGVDNATYKFNTKRNVDFDKIYSNVREFWELNQLYGSPVKVKTKIMNIYTDEQIKKFREQFLNISSEVTIEGFHKWSASDQWDIEDKNDLIKKTDTDFICAQPFSRLTVLFNGDVTPCCVDWSHKLVVGNIKNHSLDEIWNKLTNKLRLDHITNSINEESPCFDCDYKSKRTKYDKIYDYDGKLSEIFK